jgi:hypothetical protein
MAVRNAETRGTVAGTVVRNSDQVGLAKGVEEVVQEPGISYAVPETTPMFAKILEAVTGKDDLERVAAKEDLAALNAYLKTRRLLIPRRPKRFLDVSGFTQEQFLQMIREDAEDLANAPFEPWVLEMDGKRRLPAFSSQKKMETFAKAISREMNKVFALGGGEVLLEVVTRSVEIDFVDLNLFSEQSWEIGARKLVKPVEEPDGNR